MAYSQFGRLQEVRAIARARAVEDFEFFANYVLGASLPVQLCKAAQRDVEQNREVQVRLTPRAESILHAWLAVLGRKQVKHLPRTETFEWLFAEMKAA